MSIQKSLNALALNNLSLLVTRPQPANAQLCDAIRAVGGKAFSWPAIEVRPVPLTVNAECALAHLYKYTGVIFISVNAVTYGMEHFFLMPILNSLQWFAVGKATAQALEKHDIVATYPQDAETSEALLKLPQLNSVQGQRWLIVRGQGGREILADTLKERGAEVDYAEVYQRCFMPFPNKSLRDFLQSNQIEMIIFTSMSAIHAFLRCWDADAVELFHLSILVVSQRMQHEATALGFGKIYIAASAASEDIVKSLHAFMKQKA